jgi:L-amino acid N-acyltransferase
LYSIRFAKHSDLPCLVNIYNQAIVTHRATADTVPFTETERLPWFEGHSVEKHPIYVCVMNGKVTGYLSVSSYRNRPALSRTAEISYYVDASWQGKGVGSALMEYALSDALRIDKHIFLAIVLEWNAGSIRLLEKFGFKKWGYLPDVAELDGKLCGQFYYGRNIIVPRRG